MRPGDETSSDGRDRVSSIRREPLLLFVGLSIVLVAGLVALRPDGSNDAPGGLIDVSSTTVRALVTQAEELAGRPLAREEIARLVAEHVDREVLLREARSRGLDVDDARVRQRLIVLMRSALDQPVREPTAAELDAYARLHAERLRTAPSITLEHVLFAWGSDAAPEDPAAFIARLAATEPPTRLGDFAPSGNTIPRADRSRLVLLFGAEFADAVEAMPANEWTGPVTSRSGTHYVRVLERHPSEPLPAESIDRYLREDWMAEQRRIVQQRGIDALRSNYRIVLPDGVPIDSSRE